MRRALRNVIFDFGNVLIKWRPFNALGHLFDSEAEMEACLDQIGFASWNAEQDRGRGWSDALLWAETERPDHAHVFRAYAEGLDAAHDERVPGTTELIERLDARGVALFGLTNAALASFEAVRRTAPVIDRMRDVVISSQEGLIKPDPAIFRLCLDRNGLTASETLFVDDSVSNCRAAEGIGIVAHHFTSAEALEGDLTKLGLL
jgi:2-haloacid dehalogenase